jgi:hypothetical protein
MDVLKKAVPVTKLDTYIGSAYRSGRRNKNSCGCTCH